MQINVIKKEMNNRRTKFNWNHLRYFFSLDNLTYSLYRDTGIATIKSSCSNQRILVKYGLRS